MASLANLVTILKYFPSLVEFYPGFEQTLRRALRAIVGETMEKKVNVGMAKDGSGVGGAYLWIVSFLSIVLTNSVAALCALVAAKSEAH